MSEFIRNFRIMVADNERYPIPQKMKPMEYNEGVEPIDNEFRKRVTIVASWRHVGIVREEDIPLLRNNVVRNFRNVVYGEFEDQLLELQRHMYEYEDVKAREVLNGILRLVRETY